MARHTAAVLDDPEVDWDGEVFEDASDDPFDEPPEESDSAHGEEVPDAVRESNYLVKEALRDIEEGRSMGMWLRGLTPLRAVQADLPTKTLV